MNQSEQRTLSREVEGNIVPYGDPIVLPEGLSVTITHRLGGKFTVLCSEGMVSILGEYADALGEEIEDPDVHIDEEPAAGPPDKNILWEALKRVYDPEIPVNIVDLGLVYTLEVEEKETGKYFILVKMTLTAPGCGMGPVIADDAKYKILQVSGVHEANVEIVWDPPWHQDMISEEGKMELGLI